MDSIKEKLLRVERAYWILIVSIIVGLSGLIPAGEINNLMMYFGGGYQGMSQNGLREASCELI